MNKHLQKPMTIGTTLLALTVSTACATTNDQAKELGFRYANAKTESERLQIGIEAIDRRVICQRCRIEDFDAVFGTSLARSGKRNERTRELLSETIWFDSRAVEENSTPAKASDAPTAASIAGWRITIRFASDGTIADYSITNTDKFPF